MHAIKIHLLKNILFKIQLHIGLNRVRPKLEIKGGLWNANLETLAQEVGEDAQSVFGKLKNS